MDASASDNEQERQPHVNLAEEAQHPVQKKLTKDALGHKEKRPVLGQSSRTEVINFLKHGKLQPAEKVKSLSKPEKARHGTPRTSWLEIVTVAACTV